MTGHPDYYAILKVAPGATKKEIDRAYRRLAKQYHPDLNQSADAAQRMSRLNEAYEVLSRPAKRATYDVTTGRATPRRPARGESEVGRSGPERRRKRPPVLRWRLELGALLILVILLGVELGFSYGVVLAILLIGICLVWLVR